MLQGHGLMKKTRFQLSLSSVQTFNYSNTNETQSSGYHLSTTSENMPMEHDYLLQDDEDLEKYLKQMLVFFALQVNHSLRTIHRICVFATE